MSTTKPAPATKTLEGDNVPGTIGFDIYLASLGITRDALKPAKTPTIKKGSK